MVAGSKRGLFQSAATPSPPCWASGGAAHVTARRRVTIDGSRRWMLQLTAAGMCVHEHLKFTGLYKIQ